MAKKFLKDNPDLICINLDKGNIIFWMKKSDYVKNMGNFRSNYKWRKKGLLRKDIDTKNIVFDRYYGLRKINKKDLSL